MKEEKTKELYAEPLVIKHESLREMTGNGSHYNGHKDYEVPTKMGMEG